MIYENLQLPKLAEVSVILNILVCVGEMRIAYIILVIKTVTRTSLEIFRHKLSYLLTELSPS
jgi:hypothetical protein